MTVGRVISWGQWWLVIGIISLICDAVMGGVNACGGSMACLARAGGLTRGEVFEAPWQILSYGWVHADNSHIIGNLAMLWLVSIPLLRALKASRFLLLYLGAIGASGLVILLESTLRGLIVGSDPVVVGASGGLFGLLGALAAYALKPDGVFHDIEAFAIREALMPVVGLAIIHSFYPGISLGGHAGGFAFGFTVCALGWMRAGMPLRAAPTLLSPVRWPRVVGVTLVLMVLSAILPILGDLFLFGFLLLTLYGGHLVAVYEPPFRLLPAALATVLVGANVGAIGLAWQTGDLAAITPPLTIVDVEIAEGLPTVRLPEALAAERVETEDGVHFGNAYRFPAAYELRLIERPHDESDALQTLVREEPRRPWLRASMDGCPRVFEYEVSRHLMREHIVEVRTDSRGPIEGPWEAVHNGIAASLAKGDCGEPLTVPGQVNFWLSLGIRGTQRAALEALETGLEADPEDVSLRVLRIEITEEFDGCEPALEGYRELDEADIENVDLSAGLARTTLRCDRSEGGGAAAALVHVERALVLTEVPTAALHELHGEILVTVGDGPGAEAALKRAIALTDDDGERERLEELAEQYGRGVRIRTKLGG